MEALILKDSEQSYYSELFSLYDKDNLGKVGGQQVRQLLTASQLPQDKLETIAELCGAKRLGHFGRSQFYVALKLVAAAQMGMMLKADTLKESLTADVPLPRFQEENCEERNNHHRSLRYQAMDDLENTSPSDHLGKERNLWMSFGGEDSEALSDHDHLLAGEEGESSERRSSSEDEQEIWNINSEQERYYREQFSKMQPDLTLKISGSVAKEFFEKSKLAVQELSKIWQLSDIDKDGALSLSEFSTAMHLVVLRRNHIQLPDQLPPSLVPKININNRDPAVQEFKVEEFKVEEQKVEKVSSSSPTKGALSPPTKEWTKFQESPTSSVSSPGVKPVNFDFPSASVEQDPQILHPVALRVTPDVLQDEQPLMEHNATAVGLSCVLQGPKKEPPPPPPPRPRRNHARSSSLDLNRMTSNDLLHSAPPVVPPRVSPSGAGAFEVYRKPCGHSKASSSLSLDLDTVAHLDNSEKKRYMSAPSCSQEEHRKRELQVSIKMQRQRNAQLSRLNAELDQELSEIMAERIALEIQLEHIKNQ